MKFTFSLHYLKGTILDEIQSNFLVVALFTLIVSSLLMQMFFVELLPESFL
jgi:hypothetical protein